MSLSIEFDAHNGYMDDGTVITWPDATVTGVNPGDYILKNYGYASTTFTRLDATTFTITGGVDYSTQPPTVSGQPYAPVDPSNFDLSDEENADLEHFATVGLVPNANGIYPVTVHAATDAVIWHETQIADEIVSGGKLHKGSPHRGHFAGGTPLVWQTSGSPSVPLLTFVFPNSTDILEFLTDDGTGDAGGTLGGIDGGFFLSSATITNIGGLGYFAPSVIGVNGTANSYSAQWPSGSPSRAMISFCNFFPGSSSSGTTGAGSMAAGPKSFRYCYYKSLTLKKSVGGVLSSVTQTIETPLSTPLDMTTGASSSVTFTVPAPGSQWDGLRIYADDALSTNGATYVLQAQLPTGGSPTFSGSAAGSRSGNTWTLTQINIASTSTVPFASHGFAAWASGTQLAKDPNATKYFLMKWAHVSKSADTKTGCYTVSAYNGGMLQSNSVQNAPSSLLSPHFSTASAPAANKVLGLQSDGSTLDWLTTGASIPTPTVPQRGTSALLADASGLPVWGQASSPQIAAGSILRLHDALQQQGRGQFVNMLFYMQGSTTSTPTLFIKPKVAGTQMQFVPDNGGSPVNLGTAATGVVGWFAANACAGQVIVYKVNSTSNVNAFNTVSPTFDLTNSANTINGTSTDLWMKIGQIDTQLDPVTNEYPWNGYFTGAQMAGSFTQHNETILHPALNLNNPSAQQHHTTFLECVGTTCYVNYSPGGVTPTFTSTISHLSGSRNYVIQPTFFTVVASDWIYIDTTGVASGGNVTPTHANSSSFTPTAKQIVLGRVSSFVDTDGNYSTEGWHNIHKVHSHHLKDLAVRTPSIADSAVANQKVQDSAVNKIKLSTQTTAVVTGIDTFTAARSGLWTNRNWAGTVPSSQGTIGSGNMSGFTSLMPLEMLEIQVQADGGTGTYQSSPWERCKIYKGNPSSNSFVITLAQSPSGTFLYYPVPLDQCHSPRVTWGSGLNIDTLWICIYRFDLFPSGNADVVYAYIWNGSNASGLNASSGVKVNFRAVYNIST